MIREMIFLQDGKIIEQDKGGQLSQKIGQGTLQRFALGKELKND